MRRSVLFIVASVALGVVTLPASARAQAAPSASPLTRTILQQQPLSAPGRDGVLAHVELAVGGTSPRHTHAGEEIGYIMEGTVTLEVTGQAPQALKAGDAFFIPANTPHLVKNTGAVVVKLVATYIVESGKPLASPAP